MSDEKLIPVRDASELKVGMIVVATRCTRCRGSHRAMVVRVSHEMGFTSAGAESAVAATLSPVPHCYGTTFRRLAVDLAIRAGALFRVDDGLTDGELERDIAREQNDAEVLRAADRIMARARKAVRK